MMSIQALSTNDAIQPNAAPTSVVLGSVLDFKNSSRPSLVPNYVRQTPECEIRDAERI